MSSPRKSDLPMLFSDAMVKALVREARQPGTGKIQTRRLLQPKIEIGPWQYIQAMHGVSPDGVAFGDPTLWRRVGPDYPDCDGGDIRVRFAVGDRIWVRETWAVGACAEGLSPVMLSPRFWMHDNGGCWYRAGGEPSHPISPRGVWRSPIHMPRWASRLTLTVTDVRVQRLQDISEENAIAEGVRRDPVQDGTWMDYPEGTSAAGHATARGSFRSLWDSINGQRHGAAWFENPWVVALTFTVALRNIDAPVPSAEVAA